MKEIGRTLWHLTPAIVGMIFAILVGFIVVPAGYTHLYFGGSVCETTQGIYACYGYPPMGIVLVGLVLSMLAVYPFQKINQTVTT